MKTVARRTWCRNALRFGALVAASALTGCATIGAHDLIAVRAQADATRAPANPPARPSYVFAQGRFFPSMFDSDIKKLDFAGLTQTLGSELNTRFTPAPSPNRADLVIVVHWGAVVRPDTVGDAMMYDLDSVRQANESVEIAKAQGASEFKTGNYLAYQQVTAAQANLSTEMVMADSVYSANAKAAANNAELLGVAGLFRPSDTSADTDELRALLEEDRYFVTLVAFDASALRLKQKRIVWMTRMSAPVGGRDFVTAVRQMSAVAAPYFGTQQPRMILQSAAAAGPM